MSRRNMTLLLTVAALVTLAASIAFLRNRDETSTTASHVEHPHKDAHAENSPPNKSGPHAHELTPDRPPFNDSLTAIGDSVLVGTERKAVRAGLEKMGRSNPIPASQRTRQNIKDLQIPADQLKDMPTQQLFDHIRQTPLRVASLVAVSSDGGLALLKKHYNGVSEFVSRPDAAKALLANYKQAIEDIEQEFDDPIKQGNFALNFSVMETLLSDRRVAARFAGKDQQTEVLKTLLISLRSRSDYNKSHEMRFSGAYKVYAAIAIASYMEALDVPEYAKWAKQGERLLTPNQGGDQQLDLSKAYEEALTIIQMAQSRIDQSLPKL